MVDLGIAELNKNPSILDKLNEVATIVNKKNREVKGYFIPVAYKEYIQNIIDEIEYKNFLERNRSLIGKAEEDDTLLDGLDDAY